MYTSRLVGNDIIVKKQSPEVRHATKNKKYKSCTPLARDAKLSPLRLSEEIGPKLVRKEPTITCPAEGFYVP